MLEDALSYPTSGDGGIGRLFIGGLLVMFSWLIVPGLAAFGYYLRVLEGTSRGDETPPPFEDWGDLIVDGLKAAVIAFAYSIVPYLIFLLVGGSFGASEQAGGQAGGALAGLGLVAMLVGLLLAFLVQYVLPAALTNFAREGRIGAAFDFDSLKGVLVSNSYVLAVVLIFVLGIAVWFLFVFLAVVTLGLGLIVLFPLLPFFYFWLYLVGAYMFGTAFGQAVGDVKETGPTPVSA